MSIPRWFSTFACNLSFILPAFWCYWVFVVREGDKDVYYNQTHIYIITFTTAVTFSWLIVRGQHILRNVWVVIVMVSAEQWVCISSLLTPSGSLQYFTILSPWYCITGPTFPFLFDPWFLYLLLRWFPAQKETNSHSLLLVDQCFWDRFICTCSAWKL